MSSPITRRSILFHFGNDLVDAQHFGSAFDLRLKRQELADELCRPVGSALDLHHLPCERTAFLLVQQDEVGIAGDHTEQVVEIVGDPARELPTASIFCAWLYCSSRTLRSVMSFRCTASR